MLKKLVAWLFTREVKRLVGKGIDVLRLSLLAKPQTVEQAKVRICEDIQDQHKVPGELRRWACWFVSSQDAEDVNHLLTKLQQAVDRL
jgi:hypothetical protein